MTTQQRAGRRFVAALSVLACTCCMFGCPQAVDSPDSLPLTVVMEPTTTTEPEPEPEPTPEPTATSHIPPGTYEGRLECNTLLLELGVAPANGYTVRTLTVSVDENGNLSYNGTAMPAGGTHERMLSQYTEQAHVDEFSFSTDGTTVQGTAQIAWTCNDTCNSANNGLCNEILPCRLGTDCTDCGAATLEGPFTDTLTLLTDTSLQFTATFTATADTVSTASYTRNCHATLNR